MTDRRDPLDQLPPFTGASLIVAVGRDGAIGRRGALPWHRPEDLAHFRRVTMGHAVVIGAATWTSIGRALPGRHLVVVSRRGHGLPEGVECCADPAQALDRALSLDRNPVVAGGGQIYAALLDRVDRAPHLTEVDVEVDDADTFFPAVPSDEWIERASWPGNDRTLRFRVLDRIVPPR